MANFLTKCVYEHYDLSGKADDLTKINDYFTRQNFKQLFKTVVLDTVVYGNAIVITNRVTQELKRIDLADAEIRLGYGTGSGSALIQRFESIVTPDGLVNDNCIIHFKHSTSSGLLGGSIYGGWFQNFYGITRAPEALVNASIMSNLGINGMGLDTVEKIREYFNNEILNGAGLPFILLSKGVDEMSDAEFFVACSAIYTDVGQRRRELQETVERVLFPVILGRTWASQGYPSFVIKGITEV